ncbi:MAG: cell division protein ZapA [Pseudomonadota bacterium]
MADVTVLIAGRSYKLACADGEEPRLEALAARIDDEARKLSRGAAQIAEARLMLMAALMVADKLDEAETALADAPPPAPPPPPEPKKPPAHSLFAEEENEAAAARIEAATEALEAAIAG